MRCKLVTKRGPKINGRFCARKIKRTQPIDPRSLRFKKSGRAWLLIGCPKGKYHPRADYCSVGTKAVEVLTPVKRK